MSLVQTLKTIILSVFSSFVILFNYFAGVVGGIWLLVLGQWKFVFLGICAIFIFPWLYFIVTLPSVGFGMLAIYFEKKKMKAGVAIILFLVQLYDSIVQLSWIAIVFGGCLEFVRMTGISHIPLLLFAYAVSTTPFLYMASKEPPDVFRGLSVSVIVIGSILMVVLFIFGLPFIYPLIMIFVLMLIKVVFLTAVAFQTETKTQDIY